MVMPHRALGGPRGVVSVFALVLLASSCDGGPSRPSVSATITPSSPRASAPASSPTTEPDSRSGTVWPIKHVVFLVKENRTFDNLFGTFPGADGVSFGFDDGKRRPLTRGTDGSIGSEDIAH